MLDNEQLSKRQDVIFIVAKFKTKPEWSDRWIELTRPFTEATRKEPGNLWFDWSRSVDDPTVFVLVEAFQDGWSEMGELTVE